ncbi:MAG: cadherin-like beta sandwich domain-containing protein [Clostridia bacterium]|nr:cadherin-like beta sandwich domain-containing protein [Clostridia bacterium]
MKKTIKILLLTLFAIIGMSLLSNVNAASAKIKASKNQATVGEKVTITVTINAAAWDVKATGATSSHYVDNTDDLKNKTTTKTMNLDTSSAGSKTIVLSGDVTDESGQTSNVNETVTVVVSAATSAPNNNNNNNSNNNNKPATTSKSSDTGLKSVTVDGKSYTIGKTMTVGADTSSVNIKATTSNSKAKVTGTGTKELVTGTNKFTLKVTAEDGTTKSYTVTIIREEYVPDEPNIIDPAQEETPLKLVSLVAEGATLSPEFNSDIFEYSTDIVNIDELKITALATIEDANIEVIGNTELKEGKNVIVVKVTKDDKQIEYKINVTKTIKIEDTIEDKTNNEENKKVGFIGSIKNWWNTSGPMTVTLTITLILLGAAVIFAIISYKYSNGAKEASKHSRVEFMTNDSEKR